MTEKERLNLQIEKAINNLSNPKFLKNAKPEVIERERQKVIDFSNELDAIEQQEHKKHRRFLK
jgi:valyl-tRNA synthetase